MRRTHAANLTLKERQEAKEAMLVEFECALSNLITDFLNSYNYLGVRLPKQVITERLQNAIKTM